jgi:hypothetical protein
MSPTIEGTYRSLRPAVPVRHILRARSGARGGMSNHDDGRGCPDQSELGGYGVRDSFLPGSRWISQGRAPTVGTLRGRLCSAHRCRRWISVVAKPDNLG